MAVPEEIEKQTAAEIPDFSPDLNDPRLTGVKAEGDAALKESNEAYDQMIENSENFYQGQIENAGKFEDTLKKNQQDQTDFAIEKIEQQKDEAQKDYTKEQSAAYADWQKQSNAYGIEAEKRASNGMTNTGYSESSQVAMYNAYQNRVATARESLNKAMLNFDNAIKDAMLQNNAALAEIALQTFQMTSQLELEGFNNSQSLFMDKFNMGMQIKQHYDNKYLSTLDQIYNEMAMEEEARQYNQSFGLQLDEFEYNKAQDTQNNALKLILSGVGNEQLYEQAGLSFELGEALKNSYVSDREKLDLDIADQKEAQEREDAVTLLNAAKMGIKVPLTEGLKKMGFTQKMLDDITNLSSAASVSSGGGSGKVSTEEESEEELVEYHLDKTTLNNLKKSGSWYDMFDYLSERSNNGKELIEIGAEYGLTKGAICYYTEKKEITSLEMLWDLLTNYRKEEYADRSASEIMAGAYTKEEWEHSGHMMSAYDTYAEYLTKNFSKFLSL